MPAFILGSRGSALALVQTHFVIQQLSQRNPGVSFEVRKIKTQGDVQRRRPLSRMGGKISSCPHIIIYIYIGIHIIINIYIYIYI